MALKVLDVRRHGGVWTASAMDNSSGTASRTGIPLEKKAVLTPSIRRAPNTPALLRVSDPDLL